MYVRAFVPIPSIGDAGDGSGKMTHKAHCRSPADQEIERYEQESSFVVAVLMFVQIVGVDGEQSHGKAAAPDGGTIGEEVEEYADKDRCPDPEIPRPLLSVGVFYYPTYDDEKEDIAHDMPKSSMEEAIEDEFPEKSQETDRIIVDSPIDDDFRIYRIDQGAKDGQHRDYRNRAFPVYVPEIRHSDIDLFHRRSIWFSLVLQSSSSA